MYQRLSMPTSPFEQFSDLVSIPHATGTTVLSNELTHTVVLDYNRGASSSDKIRTVLCPGLGTAVGRMPYSRCAIQVQYPSFAFSNTILLYSLVQMRTAYDAVLYGKVEAINSPSSLGDCCTSHVDLCQVFQIIPSLLPLQTHQLMQCLVPAGWSGH